MTRAFVVLFVALLSSTSEGIVRPVYKILLTQKGYAQFLQYDIETPIIREFTFCSWLRFNDLSTSQAIFTYIANGNSRIAQVLLEAGGQKVRVVMGGQTYTSVEVNFRKDVWHHLCLSYQSDYGAWALYLDNMLQHCEAASYLRGYLLPRDGSVIIGYGTDDNGAQNGLEGEVYGINMILSSSIETNYTLRHNPKYDQKKFRKNKIKDLTNNNNYVIFDNLKLTTTNPTPVLTTTIPYKNIKQSTYSDIDSKRGESNNKYEQEILDLSAADRLQSAHHSLWDIINQAGHEGKFKKQEKNFTEKSGTSINEVVISVFETPPPPNSPITNYQASMETDDSLKPLPVVENNTLMQHKGNIPEIEVPPPPPPPGTNPNVYGQWTSSKYAGTVLNYLKSINYQKRQQRVPPTIPLTKVSDTLPYASDFKITKMKYPFKLQRRSFADKRLFISKRHASNPQINVQILQENIRDEIIKSHAQTKAMNVEVINRGKGRKQNMHRLYRNTDAAVSSEEANNIEEPKADNKTSNLKLQNVDPDGDSLITIMPFLKSVEYFTDSGEHFGSDKAKISKDVTTVLTKRNKWHNVKSYNSDYTPRHVSYAVEEKQDDLMEKIEYDQKQNPLIRYKYQKDHEKINTKNSQKELAKMRKLAKSVSTQSNEKNSVSLINYNQALINSNKKSKKAPSKETESTNNFEKRVKIGNALNEKAIIGVSVEDKKRSFVGGDERIPEINRYRSDIDGHGSSRVPPSLEPKTPTCRNVNTDRELYIKPDGSIDLSPIISPIRTYNTAINFIQSSYKKCSLDGTGIDNNPLLYINWNKTPVRLFGGASAEKTRDLCGFF